MKTYDQLVKECEVLKNELRRQIETNKSLRNALTHWSVHLKKIQQELEVNATEVNSTIIQLSPEETISDV